MFFFKIDQAQIFGWYTNPTSIGLNLPTFSWQRDPNIFPATLHGLVVQEALAEAGRDAAGKRRAAPLRTSSRRVAAGRPKWESQGCQRLRWG